MEQQTDKQTNGTG